MAIGHVLRATGAPFPLLTFWAAIADIQFWSPAYMRAFKRTCLPKRLLQRFCEECAVRFISSIRYEPGDMHTKVCVFDFLARSAKLSAPDLRAGNEESVAGVSLFNKDDFQWLGLSQQEESGPSLGSITSGSPLGDRCIRPWADSPCWRRCREQYCAEDGVTTRVLLVGLGG